MIWLTRILCNVIWSYLEKVLTYRKQSSKKAAAEHVKVCSPTGRKLGTRQPSASVEHLQTQEDHTNSFLLTFYLLFFCSSWRSQWTPRSGQDTEVLNSKKKERKKREDSFSGQSSFLSNLSGSCIQYFFSSGALASNDSLGHIKLEDS